VAARQREPDGIVRKRRRIQVDRIEIATEVFLVALGAVSVSQRSVKALAFGDPCLQWRVALETQIVCDATLAQPVTRHTVP
jgi:hypothetical protein